MKEGRGFSLLELLLALAIVVLCGAIGVPRLLVSLPGYRANGAARMLAGDFRLARTLAVARSADVLIQFDLPSPNRYTVAIDSDPPAPNNDHRITDKDELIKTVDIGTQYEGIGFARYGIGASGRSPSGSALPADGVSFQDSTSIFNPDGRARAGSVYLRPTRDAGVTRAHDRCITVIGSTSRTRLYTWRGGSWE